MVGFVRPGTPCLHYQIIGVFLVKGKPITGKRDNEDDQTPVQTKQKQATTTSAAATAATTTATAKTGVW